MQEYKYNSSSRLRDIIKDSSSILLVMNRFGISLGFGNKTVKDVCEENNVDVDTFLAVANFTCHNKVEYERISLTALVEYLRQAHIYYLNYNLPTIRRRLIEAIDCSGSDEAAFLILRFYDEYVVEVTRHMRYENNTVFAYVEKLQKGVLNDEYSIDIFSNKHNHIGRKLQELKDIIIGYYPNKGNDQLISVLLDIITCEQDLLTHCMLEDKIFAPAVQLLEDKLREEGSIDVDTGEKQDIDTDDKPELSSREKEIICCIAKGLTNKEIADVLFLSIHTVTTHRRNICNKLQIHTPAGLTIYAIVNKLIKLQDIKVS